MRYQSTVFALVLTLPFAAAAFAETPATQPLSPSHEAAAKKLINAMNIPEMMDKGLEQMVDVQVRQQPQLQPFRDTMLQFLQKYVSWQNLEPDYVKMYTEKFSEDEMKDLIAFYESPVGKKTLKAMPELMGKGLQLAQQRVQAHGAELQQAIMKKAQENAASATQPSSSAPTTKSPNTPASGEGGL